MEAKSFFYEMTPIYMGGSNGNDKVVSPESVPMHLKVLTTALFAPAFKGIHCMPLNAGADSETVTLLFY